MTTALRKKLLDLAISGRLTASWRDEVERKGGGGNLPSGWKMVKLGEVGQVRMCKRILKNQTVSQGDIPFFKIGTFGKTPTSYITKDVFEEYVTKYPYPKRGDILISAAGTIGRVVVFDGQPAYFQDSNIVWLEHDNSKVSNQFLYWYYQTSPWKVTKGTTIPRLYNENILNADIPLPPLKEQRAIVKRLEELLALEKEIAADTAALDELASAAKRKILDLAISGRLTASWRKEVKRRGGGGGLPSGWKTVKLGEVGEFSGGHTPSKANSEFWGGEYLWVTSKDMKSKYIEDTAIKLTKLGAEELESLPVGTLLMTTRSGILRRKFPVAIARKPCTINQDQKALRVGSGAIPEYIYIVLSALEDIILKKYVKSGTTVESVIWNKFVDIELPIPPLDEQKAIVAKVEELLAAIKNLKA